MKEGRTTQDGDEEVETGQEKVTKRHSEIECLYPGKKSPSLLFFQTSEKCLCLVVTRGNFFQWLKTVVVAGLLSQTSPSSALILHGPLVGCFLHPFRDSIFTFTGGGRCGDRISPVFGSVVNVLVILGHVWGFWSEYSSTLPPHTHPAPSHSSVFDPVKGLHLVSEHSRLWVPKVKNGLRMKHMQWVMILLESWPAGMDFSLFKQTWDCEE